LYIKAPKSHVAKITYKTPRTDRLLGDESEGPYAHEELTSTPYPISEGKGDMGQVGKDMARSPPMATNIGWGLPGSLTLKIRELKQGSKCQQLGPLLWA
jgi:hypothetical protein